ncbi:acyl-CoA carboxylase subunit beta [Amycolatopsis alkalitolerans]|uniref:Methylmalonyl-CoA carboxyltransferase n=1 Tax=Amycolatopsis alkalitolerans TaxID=2547244 RepID=A0A5C4M2M9_9PSEU|nr:carboxyl transferase domain-containing protein [Amycolatopsis alkalitolerans]TNC25150.1 methylmalonyl-CoA carboxyltransferase [Amycolatopsis alkalitolerans]
MTTEQNEVEHAARTATARRMGGEKKLRQRAEQGILNVEQRVDRLCDPGSFKESGRFTTSQRPGDEETTPRDGKIAGFGAVCGRSVAVVGYDFTVKGASSGPISNKKMQHMKDVGTASGIPVVYLSESTGVRMPDIMGGAGMATLSDRRRFLRLRENPWASAVFGYSFGSAAWHAVCSDFVVFRKGAVMAVSSPGLVGRATGREVGKEELGGWRLHAEITGIADVVADTDEEAIDSVRRFLGYLPSHNQEEPPVIETTQPETDPARTLDRVPESPAGVYDVRDVLRCVVDGGSLFELKARFARNLVTALARIGGRTIGVIASNPVNKAGAVDADACDKATSFLVLCDSFNIPVVFFADQPGFLIGVEAEKRRITGKVINWMNALSQMTVPKLTIMMRKDYGQAFVNMGGGDTADAVAAWWSAQVSFMDPRSAVFVVHGLSEDKDPDAYRDRLAEMSRRTTAYDLAGAYGAHDVIDPRDTRNWIAEQLEIHRHRPTGGVGEHLLSNWPTTF